MMIAKMLIARVIGFDCCFCCQCVLMKVVSGNNLLDLHESSELLSREIESN